MKKKILITGASGFIGINLVKSLSHAEFEIVAFTGDLVEKNVCADFIKQNTPFDVFIHLAAISSVPEGEGNISGLFITNVAGTNIVLESLAKFAPNAQFIFASSAQVYKAPSVELKLKEDSELLPQNAYARSKLSCERIIQDYCNNFNLRSTTLRFFNHSHKSQSTHFFLPSLYSQCLQAINNKQSKVTLNVGNLDVTRDISPIQNAVEAIKGIINNGDKLNTYEVFNVCSGNGVNLLELTKALTRKFELEMIINVDPAKVRLSDPSYIVGDDTKLRVFLQENTNTARNLNWLIEGFLKGN